MHRHRPARLGLAGLPLLSLLLPAVASATPVIHEIVFTPDSGSAVDGTLVVDDSELIPNTQISCGSGECIEFEVSFEDALFDLDDVFENIFAYTDGDGVIQELDVLMFDNNAPGATGYDLDMNRDGTYDITDNPVLSSGTYAINVLPEPSTSTLGALGLLGFARAAKKRARR